MVVEMVVKHAGIQCQHLMPALNAPIDIDDTAFLPKEPKLIAEILMIDFGLKGLLLPFVSPITLRHGI